MTDAEIKTAKTLAGIVEQSRVTGISARNERARKTIQQDYNKTPRSLTADLNFLKKIATVSFAPQGGNKVPLTLEVHENVNENVNGIKVDVK